MIILVTGGANSGKKEFAEDFGNEVLNLNEFVKQQINNGNSNIIENVVKVIKNKNVTVIYQEIGCGIIPMEKTERDFREITGRISCQVAKMADRVYRMYCGIPTRIK